MHSDTASFLGGRTSDTTIERLLREKKWARVVIVFASIGIFAGLSAAVTFYFHYELILTPTLAVISGNFFYFFRINLARILNLIIMIAVIAGVVIYIHVQLLRDVWQIWTYQLKYWSWIGFALQFAFCMGIFVLIALGIYNHQG